MRVGMSGMNAAIKGARELVGPIIAMTLTLATVYTPIAFQGGLTGALFREFALTLAGAVFIPNRVQGRPTGPLFCEVGFTLSCSVFILGVVALTLSPMMAAHLLRAE